MNLILWRHAEAEDGADDFARRLTPRGEKQAEQMSRWLRARLPEPFAVVASPTVRTRGTAEALDARFAIDDRLAPDHDVAALLAACGWPDGPRDASTVVVVGHQPTLGRTASLLLAGHEADWSVKKGAAWWLASRERTGRQVVLRASIAPDLA